jgi:single-stranded-DNA-specific exonuclease
MAIEDKKCNVISGLEPLGLPAEIAAILHARGYDTPEKADRFLHPSADHLFSPFILNGIAEAVQIIRRHIDKGSRILIFGDYDCDGIGAAAILFLALKELGGNPEAFIPSRLEDGYGLSMSSLNRIIAGGPPGLIITVDCGISTPDEVAYAKSFGIDFIVTDHHEPQGALPDCTLVNPKLQKNMSELCGAGVVLKLVEALADREFALQYVDLCAISTIADLVPLTGENRVIARLGLNALSSRNRRPGINALFKAARIRTDEKPIDSGDIAYKIAPRLNASGRLSHARKSFQLLVEKDPTQLMLIAEELEAENKRRQELCQQTIDDAVRKLKDYDLIHKRAIILEKEDWEGGIIGIAASKLAQDYYRPAILFTRRGDVFKGSCRSIPGINIHEVLSGCKEHILQYGGHSMAAGLTIQAEKLEAFKEAVCNYIARNYEDSVFYGDIRYDVEVDIRKIDIRFSRYLEYFEPYGNDNPEPTFMYRAGSVPFRRIGNNNHIKYSVSKECDLLAFNYYNRMEILTSEMQKSLFFTVEHDVFRNKESAKCCLRNYVLEEIAPRKEALLIDYLRTLLPDTKPHFDSHCGEPSSLYGHLAVAYCYNTFLKLCETYPSYKRAYRYLDSVNPYNTVILSPVCGTDMSNFCRIEYHDKHYFEAAAAEDGLPCMKQGYFDLEVKGLDVACLKEIYVFLLTTRNGTKYFGPEDLYASFLAKEYKRERCVFDIACLIFRELDLLNVENGIIIIKNHKVELQDSRIYRSLRSLCRLS